MGNKVTIDAMARELIKSISDYGEAAVGDVKDCCRQVARETTAKLKKESPKQSGKYGKSWKTTTVSENRAGIQIAIHAGKYQLSHLLENGHAKRSGGRVKAIPHIKPLEEAATTRLVEEIGKIL